MPKRVVIIASGETERRALPCLLAPLEGEGIVIDSIVTPPRHQQIDAYMAERLLLSAWYSRDYSCPPDKFVILVDADGKDPHTLVSKLEASLEKTKCQQIPVPIRVAAAKWHLEAWFWADPFGLREFLGRNLGDVDHSDPDAMTNPNYCLKQLLGEPYTSRVAEEIAQRISLAEVRTRSSSFVLFEKALRNGPKSSEK